MQDEFIQELIAKHGDLLSRIDDKKRKLDRLRPIPGVILNNLQEALSLEWTYNSNSIEGNTLTLAQTRVVIADGMTIGGKSLREHFETINHDKAIVYLEELIDPSYQLRAIDLLKIHEIIMRNIDEDYAGRYRSGAVRIQGANVVPPNPKKVPDLIAELISWVNDNKSSIHPVILAAVFHHRFEAIHPFFDGNGRTGRLIFNLVLMSQGYPPAIILKNDRKIYYSSLNQANKNNYNRLVQLIGQAMERSLNIYLNAFPDAYQDFRSISNIVEDEEVPYGIEYISLLARRGKISAHKEGRNWVTSKEEIMDYHAKHGNN